MISWPAPAFASLLISLEDDEGMQSLHWASCLTVEWSKAPWLSAYMQILNVCVRKDEWSSITNPVRVESLCENTTKILESRSLPLSITRTHIHTHRAVGLFTDHYSWQWVLSRKCLVENNRHLPLQLKKHPSAIQRMCVCVCVFCLHFCVF